MAKLKVASGQEFWNSDLAIQIVRDHHVPEWSVALGEPVKWSLLAGEEVWQSLSQEVRDRAHRGYQQTGLLLMTTAFEDAKHAAGVYGQLKARLVAFAHLLRTWRKELTAVHGNDCWDRILGTIHDPKEKVVIERLRQVSSRTIDDAVNDLDGQGREGFTYQLAGQHPVRLKPSDCGIELFVEAARLFEKRLIAQKQPVADARPAGAAEEPNSWPRVMIYIEQGRIKLTRRTSETSTTPEVYRECFLDRPKFIHFFWALYWCKGRISREELYTQHTHKEDHGRGERYCVATQSRVTQLRKEFEEHLTEHLGTHPVLGTPWISKGNKNGYCFTRGVRFQPHDKDLVPDK